MRKIDYQHLADVIRRERERAEAIIQNPDQSLPDEKALAQGMRCAAEAIAGAFASRANVDRTAFMKACGIE